MRILSTLLLGAALVAGAPAVAADSPRAEAQLAKALDGRVAGKPVSCISLSSITSSQVIDGTAILYRVGATIYVNRPRMGGSSLDSDDILVTKTYGGNLCNLDMVSLVDRGARFERGFVGLGEFVPYKKVPVARD